MTDKNLAKFNAHLVSWILVFHKIKIKMSQPLIPDYTNIAPVKMLYLRSLRFDRRTLKTCFINRWNERWNKNVSAFPLSLLKTSRGKIPNVFFFFILNGISSQCANWAPRLYLWPHSSRRTRTRTHRVCSVYMCKLLIIVRHWHRNNHYISDSLIVNLSIFYGAHKMTDTYTHTPSTNANTDRWTHPHSAR